MQLFDRGVRVILFYVRENAGDQVHKPHDDKGDRPQDKHEGADRNGEGPGKPGRVFFGRDLGHGLAEDDDRNCDDQGGDPGEFFAQDRHHGQRSQGGCGYVDQVVAHQDGGQGVVIALPDPDGQAGLLVPVVPGVLQADAAAGGKGHLRGREKG